MLVREVFRLSSKSLNIPGTKNSYRRESNLALVCKRLQVIVWNVDKYCHYVVNSDASHLAYLCEMLTNNELKFWPAWCLKNSNFCKVCIISHYCFVFIFILQVDHFVVSRAKQSDGFSAWFLISFLFPDFFFRLFNSEKPALLALVTA